MPKKVLGKGLGAIISSSPTPVDSMEFAITEAKDRIVELELGAIRPNPDQPRTHFNEGELEGLAESIRNVGLIQPIVVRRDGESYYIVAGERRLRASKLAGLQKIKSIVIRANEEENLTLALIENIQRTDLDPIEEAKAYRLLITRFRLKQQDVAQRVGKDRATVANLMRLLYLPEQIQRAVSEGRISVGHAKVLLALPPERQNALFNEILDKGCSVRMLEKMVESGKDEDGMAGKGGAAKKSGSRDTAHIRKMEEMLVSFLGTKVEIRHSGGKGRIEISYYSLDDFERIIEILRKGRS
ncbi:MAG TPA: ParB/RepB/Spo0J family partition protein [Spirochaetota bacterium]|nr:ParB/RepB/Spo0J family partition protein [Spirochaetota bacterium]